MAAKYIPAIDRLKTLFPHIDEAEFKFLLNHYQGNEFAIITYFTQNQITGEKSSYVPRIHSQLAREIHEERPRKKKHGSLKKILLKLRASSLWKK
jgi:hypothetical protein